VSSGSRRCTDNMINKVMDWLFEPTPIDPAIQARFDRHNELSKVRLELLLTLGREPTANEIWNEAS